MSGRSFLDTDVLVYAYDGADVQKQARAQSLLADLPPEDVVLSSQVLSEFYVTVTRKLATPLAPEDAASAVRGLSALRVLPVDAALVVHATGLQVRWQTSYWDALILAAAAASGCDRLLSEDLASGAVLAGVRVENPFA